MTRQTRNLISGLLGATCAAAIVTASALAADRAPAPRATTWLASSYASMTEAPAKANMVSELAALRAITAKRTADDVARFTWWATGGPAYRWNEIILAEMQEAFVVLPMAARHLALFQVAIHDAVGAAHHARGAKARSDDGGVDDAVTASAGKAPVLRPSAHAAAAAAAADVLVYLFPARATQLAAMEEEAIQVRLTAGAEFPTEIAAGRAIGRKVAALAIARGQGDGSSAKWSGTVPEGPGRWKGTNPIAPLAGTWQTWVLSSPSELRPPAPPAVDSDAVKGALTELKAFQRTPKTNHRAIYWEVHGGARAHALWNEVARTKLLESRADGRTAARVLATLNMAMADAGTACWDAKYAFWYVRPSQLDAELTPLFAPPKHPSYPAAHGCYSTAAATVLADIFLREAKPILTLGKEAAEARVWAGIHYRFDIDAGQEIGRKVGERALARAFSD
jgi:hypothetical protein